MDRPFVVKNTWIFYVAIWMVLSAIQFALSYGVYDQSILTSLTDSVISNMLFSLFGVGLWYMIRFSGDHIQGIWQNIIYHLFVCAVTLFLWMTVSYSILNIIFETDKKFIEFINKSLIIRIVTGALLYLLLISFDYLILSLEEMKERADHEAALAAMLRDAELNMLRSQIRPHFLFNSLNSVSALTLTNPPAAQEMIIKLSEFMRHSLSLGSEAMGTLADELYHVGLYLDIEKVRFSDRLRVEKEINCDCGEILLPAMILQPLLENAVKHGVNTMLTTCTIRLEATCTESFLNVTISNDFDPDAIPRKGTGTGLKNVQKRMSAVYGRTDLLNCQAKENIFFTNLLVPVQKKSS